MRRRAGFSLVELITVIVIIGVLAAASQDFIARPLLGYRDLNRRAALVQVADQALRRMARDLRRALPNSVRVAASGQAIEFLHTVDGGRYRAQGGSDGSGASHVAASDILSFAGDDAFNVAGRLRSLPFSYGTPLAAGHRLAVYSTGAGIYADAATSADPGAITPASTTITITQDGDEENLALSSSFRFALASPSQRVFVVDGPVSFLCDTSAETLTRYSSYTVSQTQPVDPAAAPLDAASASLLGDRVESCSFEYSPGTPQRAGLVILSVVIEEADERVSMLYQVHIDNAP